MWQYKSKITVQTFENVHTQKMASVMRFIAIVEVQEGHRRFRSNVLPTFPSEVNENLSIYTTFFIYSIYFM